MSRTASLAAPWLRSGRRSSPSKFVTAPRGPRRCVAPRRRRRSPRARARSPGAPRARASQRRGQRLAIRREDVAPQLGIALGDAREVAEARARDGVRAGRRGLERAGEGEGQHVGDVAHPGDLGVVLRRVAVYHMRAERAPEFRRSARSAAASADARHDAGRALEEIRARVLEAAQVAARHRVRSDVARRRAAAGPAASRTSTAFTLPTSVTMAPARSAGAIRCTTLGHREDRRREHDQVRVARGFGVAPGLVDGAARSAAAQRVRAARGARRRARATPRAFAAERDRAAEQAQPQHRDAFEARRHFPPSRRRRSVFDQALVLLGQPDADAHVVGHARSPPAAARSRPRAAGAPGCPRPRAPAGSSRRSARPRRRARAARASGIRCPRRCCGACARGTRRPRAPPAPPPRPAGSR